MSFHAKNKIYFWPLFLNIKYLFFLKMAMTSKQGMKTPIKIVVKRKTIAFSFEIQKSTKNIPFPKKSKFVFDSHFWKTNNNFFNADINRKGIKKPIETILDQFFFFVIGRVKNHLSRRYPRKSQNLQSLAFRYNYVNNKFLSP